MKRMERQTESLYAEAEGTVRIRGEAVSYRVVSEETCLAGDTGAKAASLFSYSYFRTDCEEKKKRPVLFCFNGGPGSSSLWLHLGLFGPERVTLSDPVNPSPLPPFAMEENPHCLLDLCDVVLIDPPGTGLARVWEEDSKKELFSLTGDARAIALFLEGWLERYDRYGSPKYLAGESYGTVRIGYLLRELMGGPMETERRLMAIPVNGVLLLGTALNLPCFSERPAGFEPAAELLAFACVHHYHHPEGKPELAEWKKEVWEFAGREYLAALFSGENAEKKERDEVLEKLAYYTGVAKKEWKKRGLMLSSVDFSRLVLEEEGLDAGLYDGRYTMTHREEIRMADPVAEDAAMGKYTPAFVGAMNDIWKKHLGLTTEREYRAIDFAVNGQWSYEAMVTPRECLTAAMRRNEEMRLFFGSGVYDLVTHPGMVRFLAGHGGFPPERVVIREYESGHMPYLGEESAAALERDIREFVTGRV